MNAENMSAREAGAARLPLAGVVVLDVAILIQGPLACQILADMGASVIKIELPGEGDMNRLNHISSEDHRSHYFFANNRGKRSITLDLRTQGGRNVLLRMVRSADVMVSNFTPGTLERWGLGYEVVKKINPRIVFATGSNFGALGPDAGIEGADLAAQAAGGLISTTGTDDGPLTPVGAALADHQAGQNLAIGILGALRAAERDGVGQHLDVSLLGGQIWAQGGEYTYYFLSGKMPGRANLGHPLVPTIYGIFATADGWIAITGVPPKLRAAFWEVMERPDLAADPRFTELFLPKADLKALFAELQQTFLTRTTEDWAKRLKSAGQRFAHVWDYEQAAAYPQLTINGYLQEVDHPEYGRIKVLGSPIQYFGTPLSPAHVAPKLGEHTAEVLAEFGFGPDEIRRLHEQGAI
jgi:crotonobetainyl-CoA:carnitine CoA-transferase CaiB-like acyl-CoA transferase